MQDAGSPVATTNEVRGMNVDRSLRPAGVPEVTPARGPARVLRVPVEAASTLVAARPKRKLSWEPKPC